MKKMLVLLIVLGFLIGTFAVVEEMSEENTLEIGEDLYDGESADIDNITPCGGGNGDGGIPG